MYVRGDAPGSSLVELEFRDPVTHDREHKTTRVTFVGESKKTEAGNGFPTASGGPGPNCGPDEF